MKVTQGQLILELEPDPAVDQEKQPTFDLKLKTKAGSAKPASLGIYRISDAGYPVECWWSRKNWKGQPTQPNESFPTVAKLETHFQWMVSDSSSGLVRQITYFLQQMRESGQQANEK